MVKKLKKSGGRLKKSGGKPKKTGRKSSVKAKTVPTKVRVQKQGKITEPNKIIKGRKRKASTSIDESPIKARRQVSFNPIIEHSDADQSIKSVEARGPRKGILSKKNDISNVSDELHSSKNSEIETEMLDSTTEGRGNIARPRIKVARGVKEKLATMSRKERKEFIRNLKKKRKPNYDLMMKCKSLWEKLRRTQTSVKDKEKYVNELTSLIEGKTKELIYAHDTCRVIECLISLPRRELREFIFDELMSEVLKMAKSKYAHFILCKMLKYGSPIHRNRIIEAFRGHYVNLMRNSFGSKIVDTIYEMYASSKQKKQIVFEFFGQGFPFFLDNAEESTEVEDESLRIKGVLSEKKVFLDNLYEVLKDIASKMQLRLSLTHTLMQIFFDNCTAEQKDEMIDLLKDHIPEIVHTKAGTNVALECIWGTKTKDRKIIVKNFKDLVVKACLDRYGYLAIIGVLETIDDTVLVNKYILKEIAKNIAEIINSASGSKVIHHLLHPRDFRFFTKQEILLIQKGDENPNSKKPASERYKELFSYIIKPIIDFIVLNMEELMYDGKKALLILDALEVGAVSHNFSRDVDDDDRSRCYETISKICAREFIPCDAERFHAIEFASSHFVIAKLLKCDSQLDVKLGDHLITLGKSSISSWISCNKGCFILLNMFENGSEKSKNFLRESISEKELRKYSTNGAVLLLAKLSS